MSGISWIIGGLGFSLRTPQASWRQHLGIVNVFLNDSEASISGSNMDYTGNLPQLTHHVILITGTMYLVACHSHLKCWLEAEIVHGGTNIFVVPSGRGILKEP